jgi:uncharacterized protein (TIGR03086 family)
MGVDGAAEVSWARAEGKVSPQKRDCVATAADAASLWLRARKARHSERIREEEIAMGSTPADQLAQALDTTERLINGIGDDQWTNATPCTDWTVRDLVNHVVFGNWLFAGLLAGNQPPPLDEMLRQQSTDRLAADPAGAYRASADALLESFRQPGVLEQVFAVPIGPVPGIVALHLRIAEALVHGWDIAEATGQSGGYPDDLAEQELAFSRDKMADIPPGRRPFGPPQPIADDASAIDRLAAALGRPRRGSQRALPN